MGIRARQVLLSSLVLVFAIQTWLVYSDPAGTVHALSYEALRGQEIWRDLNCQSCHQIYGFGGFLGPDLTNAVDGISPERMTAILTDGAGQMPAFHLDAADRAALTTFLRELDATGVSQPKLGDVATAAELLQQIVEVGEERPPDVAQGWEVVRVQNCIACHLPNEESPHGATNLTTITKSVSRERMLDVLRDPNPPTPTPPPPHTPHHPHPHHPFLAWLGARGEEVRRRFENRATSAELSLSRVPWFEYE